MLHALRNRIYVPYIALILLTVLALGYYLSRTTTRRSRDFYFQSLLIQSRLIADLLEPALSQPAASGALVTHVNRSAALTGAQIRVYSADGAILAASEAAGSSAQNPLSRPEIQRALRGDEVFDRSYTDPALGTGVVILEPLYSDTGLSAVLELVFPPDELDPGGIDPLLVALIFGFVASLGVVLISNRVSAQANEPARSFIERLEQLAAGERLSSLDPASEPEWDLLSKPITRLIQRWTAQLDELSAERARLVAIVRQMSDAVLLVLPDGRVLLRNPAAERIFEAPASTPENPTVVELVRHHQIVELWRRCQASGEAQTATVELGAQRTFLHILAMPFEIASPGAVLILIEDLTEVRRLETVRRDFVSNISHELRTPLASLKALSDTLQEGALEDPPAARRFLEQIDHEVDALAQLVSELLELSRIESGKVPLQLRPVAPAVLVEEAVERLRLQAERGGLRTRVSLPPDLRPVLADPIRIQQVLVNLIHNAIKFTPSGGEIAISAEVSDDQVVFCVRDTGSGIPADELPRIFERFYKMDRSRAEGGTGLGLAIARHLVEAHGGRIWAESRLGRGSAFFFSLPAPY